MHLSASSQTVQTSNIKMYKYIIFICAFSVLQVKSDCDGYFDCFNSFFNNFFVNTETNVEYINTTTNNLPENFVEVKDVGSSELDRVLSEISSFIQQDLTDQLKLQSNSAIFTNVNPKTKLYVNTFSYNDPGNIILPDFNNILSHEDTVKKTDEENVKMTTKPSSHSYQTVTKRNEVEIIQNQKDVSENEISNDVISYYDSVEDNSTDYPVIDYVELYKDTTNEENLYEPTEIPMGPNIKDEIQESVAEYVDGMDKIIWNINNNSDSSNSTDVSSTLAWISTIFLKNDSKSNQFEYYCDGALLNEQVLITAARCVTKGNLTVEVEDLLVILGKRSLLSMADKEKTVKIKQIITHEIFTNENGIVENDLALLFLEDHIVFNEIIQPATMGNKTEDVAKSFTTAWNLQGDIVPVSLESGEVGACGESGGENMFCAAYGQAVPLCPSYGGIFVGLQDDTWHLYGVRSGDVSDRGICFNKNVWFTDLRPYGEWIEENLY